MKGKEEHTVAEGTLIKYYPDIIKGVFLMYFKVRVANSVANATAKVRVLIESSDASKKWKIL